MLTGFKPMAECLANCRAANINTPPVLAVDMVRQALVQAFRAGDFKLAVAMLDDTQSSPDIYGLHAIKADMMSGTESDPNEVAATIADYKDKWVEPELIKLIASNATKLSELCGFLR